MLKLPKDIHELVDNHVFSIWALIASYFFLVTVIIFVQGGAKKQKVEVGSFLQPGYNLVEIKMSPDKRNKIYSNVEVFEAVERQLEDTTAVIMDEELIVSSSDKRGELKNQMMRSYFVTDQFFKSVKGRKTLGNVFSRNKSSLVDNIVVVTPGAAEIMFGDRNAIKSHIYVKGKRFKVIGGWEFDIDNSKENRSLIFPLTALKKLRATKTIQVKKFIVKNVSEKKLNELRKAFESILIAKGFANPDIKAVFEIMSLERDPAVQLASDFKVNLLSLVLYFIVIGLCTFSVFVFDKSLAMNPEIFATRLVFSVDSKSIYKDFFNSILLNLLFWGGVGVLAALGSIWVLSFYNRTDLYFKPYFSYSYFGILFFVFLLIFYVKRRCTTQFKWKRWV